LAKITLHVDTTSAKGSAMPSPDERDTAVLIAAYNAEATLGRAVASALAQPEVVEVCVVDDKSRDATIEIAKAWAERDSRVKVLYQAQNGGPAPARNRAIEATHAPWVTVLDADDYLLEGRLKVLLDHAEGADFVADALVRTREGAPLEFAPAPFSPVALNLETFVLGDLPRRGQINYGFLKPMMRRAFLDRFSLRYDEAMRLGEDFDLYARALAHGARFLLGGPAGYVSIERPGSLSLKHGAAELQLMRNCHESIEAVRPLSEAETQALRQHWRFVDRRLQWSRFVDAFKARDFTMLLSTFGSLDAAWFVLSQLGEQVWLRGTAFARGAPQRGE
jgi:succinoglycan biosynthesis protein ExoU